MWGTLLAAWLDVRSRPLRTIAAMLGMVAAITAVVVIDGAHIQSRRANDEYVVRAVGLPVTARITSVSTTGANERDDSELNRLLTANGIRTVSSFDETQVDILSATGSWDHSSVRIVTPEYAQIRVVDLVAGDFPKESGTAMSPRIVVTPAFARQMGWEPEQAVGQIVMIRDPFQPNLLGPRYDTTIPVVIDAVASTTSNAFEAVDVLLVTRRPEHLGLTRPTGGNFIVRVNPDEYGHLQETVDNVMAPDGTPAYSLRRIDQAGQFAPLLEQQKVTGRIVSAIALAIGGLGILSVGLASVRERAQEFGLRRALGSNRIKIFFGVITQTLIESLIAAGLSIAISEFVLQRFGHRFVLESLPLPPNAGVPMQSALIGLVAALSVGLIASVIPAISAARVSVATALRG